MYDAVQIYIQIYTNDFNRIHDIFHTECTRYLHVTQEVKEHLVELHSIIHTQLLTYRYTGSGPVYRNLSIPSHLFSDVENIITAAEIYWIKTRTYKTQQPKSSVGEMFIVGTEHSCNVSYGQFIASLRDISSHLSQNYLTQSDMQNFTTTYDNFIGCSNEYWNAISSANSSLESYLPLRLNRTLVQMYSLVDSVDVYQLHSPLIQDEQTFSELIVSYYQSRLTKLQLSQMFAGSFLDDVQIRIKNFFFHIDVELSIKLAGLLSQCRSSLIDSYHGLLHTLATLNNYIRADIYKKTLYDLNLWSRTLAVLTNKVVEIHTTSTGQ